jgi:predicted nucleic acid-binding protein
MSRMVLADTGPLYALADPSDQFHARAAYELKRLQGEQFDVATAHPILMEAYSLILRRLGLRRSQIWLKQTCSGVGLINPAPEDYLDAIRVIDALPDQRLTLFDGLLAVLSRRLALPVWTFDRHFELMRARVWRPD